MLVPEVLRSVTDSFALRIRGYDQSEVRIYLGRLALAVEAYGDVLDPELELPPYFTPAAISSHQFEVVGWGYSRRQVQSFLDDVAGQLATRQVIDIRTSEPSHATNEQ